MGIPELELEIARSGSPSEDDRWQQRSDGSRFWASGAVVRLVDESEKVVGLGKIFRNRTDLRMQFDTLRNQAAAHSEKVRTRETFLKTVAHELRNPLTPMLTTCHALRKGSSDPTVHNAVQLIERQIGTMVRLLDDMLDVEQQEAGQFPLEAQPLALNDLLRDVAETLRPQIEERRQRLDVMLPPDTLRVNGDRDRLQQVFLNLLANATKFTPEGGRIWLKATTEGSECVARVEDTGVGLEPDQMTAIFEMFARADSAAAVPGHGVGLALVKHLVERHRGSVQAESDGPGTGSKFVVRLPVFADALPDNP
jgi:signal transduction histidine kinase